MTAEPLKLTPATIENLKRVAKKMSSETCTYSPSDAISILIGYYEEGTKKEEDPCYGCGLDPRTCGGSACPYPKVSIKQGEQR